MSAPVPLTWIWEGDAMRPASPTWAKRADAQFVIGERYTLEQVEDRTGKSHRHLFAIIKAAWLTLPEELALEFPNEEALRKYLLVKAGHCTAMKVPCPDRQTAMNVVTTCRALDEFAVVTLTENVVTVYRAKSIAYREVGKKQFQAIKSAVMDILADMLHITPEQLKDADKSAAPEYTALEYLGAP